MAARRFSRIGDVLPSVLRSLGLEQRFRELQVVEAWPAVAGDEIAERTRADRLDDGVLYVYVDHGAWMQELRFIEKDLLGRLRERVPGVVLDRIRFSVKRRS